jgi:translation initiation factor IF-2
MDNKKTKLTLSGIAKKSIENIQLAKTKGKNSVEIEKKPTNLLIEIILVDQRA